MNASLSLLLGLVAFTYSTGCVIYYEWTKSVPPDFVLFPIAPGIWVGAAVDRLTHLPTVCSYAAGIVTMTILGATVGSIVDSLCSKRRSD